MGVTLHMVTSLDGYVAKNDGDVSWMDASWDAYGQGEEMTDHVLKSIDCYILGSHTYELAQELGWPYGDTRTIVVTNRHFSSARANVEFYSGDLTTLIADLKLKNVWLVGGPTLCQEFFRLALVDKVCLTIVPILLGGGVSLFRGAAHKLRLQKLAAYKNGMVDLWYDVARTTVLRRSY